MFGRGTLGQPAQLQPNAASYPPATLYDTLPESEKQHYERKEKYLQKNKEKIRLIKERKKGSIEKIGKDLSELQARKSNLQQLLGAECEKKEQVKRMDCTAWEVVEEGERLNGILKKGERPVVEFRTRYFEELLERLDETISECGVILKRSKEILSGFFEKEVITTNTLSNLLLTQQECYNALLESFLKAEKELVGEKEKYRQRRRDFFSDYTDPFNEAAVL